MDDKRFEERNKQFSHSKIKFINKYSLFSK